MKKKVLFALTILLVVTGLLSITNGKVSASRHHSYFWWLRPRTVRVIKRVRIYEMNGRVPTYRRRPFRSKVLHKGRIVKINHGWSYVWIVQGRGLVRPGHYAWVCNRSHWFKLK